MATAFRISVANAYDNAKAESFMKTLKAEALNGKACATLAHARRDIRRFIDTAYNTRRLHSALGYKPPVECQAEPDREESDWRVVGVTIE